jgi:hypothetical protein
VDALGAERGGTIVEVLDRVVRESERLAGGVHDPAY